MRPYRIAAQLFAFLLAAAPLGAQRTWTLVEDLRLGTGDDPNLFGYVGGIAVTKNGNVFVVDKGKPLQIKLFSPTGQFLRAVGRTGSGPGEYQDVAALLSMPDGNVLAVAPKSARVIVYSAEGLHVRTTPTAFLSYGGDWVGTVLADGSLIDPIRLFPKDMRSTTREPPKALQRVLANGTRADTLRYPACEVQHPSKDAYVHITQANGSYMQTGVPFLPFAQAAFANDGTVWCSPTDVYSIFHFRVGRPDTLHSIRLNVPAPAIPPDGRADMDRLLARADNKADITVPNVQPTIRAIRVDDTNRLWVRRTATPDSAPSFDLYDAQGRSLGVVQSTVRWDLIPLVVGDYAYGLVLGADDVAYMVRAKLRP